MKEIKKVLRRLEYGVYVVSMGKGTSGNAFTASWICQVSSEPPVVAVSVHSKHQSARLLGEEKCFVINLLGHGQEGVAKTYFGPAESGYEKLQSAEVTEAPATGAPVLNGAAGFLDCALIETTKIGNHTVFFGEVKAAKLNEDVDIMTTSNSNLHYAG